MPAANESDKGKKDTFALASERRHVESAPPPMKKDPDHNSTDPAEIEAIITRLGRGQFREGDAQLPGLPLRLIILLQQKNASPTRLKRQLFGPWSDARWGLARSPPPELQRHLRILRLIILGGEALLLRQSIIEYRVKPRMGISPCVYVEGVRNGCH